MKKIKIPANVASVLALEIEGAKGELSKEWKKQKRLVLRAIDNALSDLADENDLPPVPFQILKNMMEQFK